MLSCLIAAAVAAAQPAALPPLRHGIAVIAHRGGSALAPENTVEAFRSAARVGADFVEMDVRTTSDGTMILMHDGSVDRTTDGRGRVRDLDLAAVRALRVRGPNGALTGAHVPTLEEALAACRGRASIYLDFKDGDAAAAVAALRKFRMERRVVVYGGTDALREWKRLAPEIPVMPSLPTEYRRAGGIDAYLATFRPEVLDGHQLEWTKALVAEAHRAGVKVYVDALGPTDNSAGYAQALDMGVDGIQTDHPDKLAAYLKRAPPSPGKARTTSSVRAPAASRTAPRRTA